MKALERLNQILEYYKIQKQEDSEIANSEYSRQIYFDSYDIIRIIQGIWALNKAESFDVDEFKNNRNLEIYAALERGWIGKVRLLRPHQDELLLKLTDSEILFPQNQSSTETVKLDFIGRIDFNSISNQLTNKKLLREQFKKFGFNSETLFKIYYILKPLGWYDRFKKFNHSLFELNFEVFKYENFNNDELFQNAFRILKRLRKSRSYVRSNYIDAMSIVSLQKKLDRFNNRLSNEMPVFFASTKYITATLKQLYSEDNSKLSIYKGSKKVPAFRESSFFKIDALFNALKSNEINSFIDDIEDLREKLDSTFIGRKTDVLSPHKSLTVIDNNIEVNFYEKIWDNEGYTELINIVKELTNPNRWIAREDLSKTIEEFKSQYKEKYSADLFYVRYIREFWNGLHNIQLNRFTELIPEGRKIKPFTDFALTRFPIIEEACDTIKYEINSLANSVHESEEEDVNVNIFHTHLVNKLSFCIKSTNLNKQHTVLFILLWILGEYDLIVELFRVISEKFIKKSDSESKLDFHKISLYSIYGSAIPISEHRDLEILESIIVKFKQCNEDNMDNYKLHIMISYLSFQLWKTNTEFFSIPEKMMSNDMNKAETFKKYYIDALKYIKMAYTHLETAIYEDSKKQYRKRKYYYCINSIIYYTTKGGSETDFFNLGEYLERLNLIKNHNYLWQGRFYDTFGWYEFRSAIIKKRKELEYKNHLIKAREYNSLCYNNPNTQRELNIYDKLKNEISFEMDLLNDK